MAKFFILGNHDLRTERRARLRAATDARRDLCDVGGRVESLADGPIVVAGNELPLVSAVGSGDRLTCPRRRCGFCCHTRRINSPGPQRHQFDLMLAGHTHGGQIRFPLVGPVVCPSRHGTKYASGFFTSRPTLLHVSRGTASLFPYRLNCPPGIDQARPPRKLRTWIPWRHRAVYRNTMPFTAGPCARGRCCSWPRCCCCSSVGLACRRPARAQANTPTTQTVERSFVIDEDFTKVRKILVRTDATKQIVTMTGDSEFIDQQWNTIGARTGGLKLLDLDLKWQLELERHAVRCGLGIPTSASTKSRFSQTSTSIRTRSIRTSNWPRRSERLRQYAMTTWFHATREWQVTGAAATQGGDPHRRALVCPLHCRPSGVRQSAEQALENQEQAIRQIIEENRDQRWLLLE